MTAPLSMGVDFVWLFLCAYHRAYTTSLVRFDSFGEPVRLNTSVFVICVHLLQLSFIVSLNIWFVYIFFALIV